MEKIKNKFCPDYLEIRDAKISYDPQMGIPDSKISQSIWNFFTQEIYPKAKKDNRLQLTAELKYVLNRTQNYNDPYILVCVLNDSILWTADTLEWKEIKKEFCKDYDRIRNTPTYDMTFPNINIRGHNSRLIKKVDAPINGILPLEDLNSEDDQYNVASSIISEKQTIESFQHKIQFSFENIDLLSEVITKFNPRLSNKALKYIRKNLEYVLNPIYAQGQTKERLLERLQNAFTYSKYNKIDKSGKDMAWLNEAYETLDIEKTIKGLRSIIKD